MILLDVGDTVRTAKDDLIALDGSIIPIGSVGMIIGGVSEVDGVVRALVDFIDFDTGEPIAATVDVGNLIRVRVPHG